MYANPEDAFASPHRMFELIENIYAAAQDETLWPVVLASISSAIHGESIALFAGFPDFRTPDLYAHANFPTGFWQAFSGYYAQINPIMERCEAMFSPEIPWASELAIPDAELETTEFYNDFFQPHDMHYSLGLRLTFDGQPAAALSVQRSKRLGAFDDSAKFVFQTLRPHLQRAFQLHYRISNLEAKALGLETALEAHDHAVLGLDRNGNVCFSNLSAQALFARADGVRLTQSRLCCTRPDENQALQQMIASQVLGCSEDQGIANGLLVSRDKTSSSLHLTILPMSKTLSGRSVPLAALIFITDTSRASSRAALVRKLYGVTPSEARVADLLLQGFDTREISDRLRTTAETTRFQIKQLLSKTSTRRQAELLRLLAALPGVAATP